jgi:hypothetical protein
MDEDQEAPQAFATVDKWWRTLQAMLKSGPRKVLQATLKGGRADKPFPRAVRLVI